MIESTPFTTEDIPFDGSGPVTSEGAQPSDPRWGRKVMVSGPVSIQYEDCYAIAYAPRVIEMAEAVPYPGAGLEVTDGASPLPTQSLHYDYQDLHVAITAPSPDETDLGAPSVQTGGTAFYGRP